MPAMRPCATCKRRVSLPGAETSAPSWRRSGLIGSLFSARRERLPRTTYSAVNPKLFGIIFPTYAGQDAPEIPARPERARRQRQKQRPVADQTGCRSLNHKRRPKSIAGHITYALPQSTAHGGFKMPLRKVSLRNPAGSENPAVSPWLCQLI
jgi:hypothetical protein